MRFRTLIYKVLAVCAVVSCSKVGNLETSSEGYIDLKVSMDASTDEVAVTKSASDDVEIAVQVVSTDGKVVYQSSDINSVTEPVKVQTGDYQVYATCGTDAGAAAFDAPFYTGTAPVQVRAHTVAQARVVCGLSGVKVTASFSQEIKDKFTYSLSVGNGLGTLVYGLENEGAEGYFSATGTLAWTLNLENAKGEKFVVKDTYTDVQPKQHYDLSFSLESVEDQPYGVTEFRIVLDNSLNETYHVPTIWINEDGPAIAGNDYNEVYVCDQPATAVYDLHSTRKYNNVSVIHTDSRLLQYGLPYSTDFVKDGISAFVDATGIGVQAIDENGAAYDAIEAEVRDIALDFTSFYSNLPVGEYEVGIFVENESGLTAQKTIRFNVLPAVSLMKLSPWAKFMFVKGSWVSDSQPAGLKVQYKTSASSQWVDFTPSEQSQFIMDQSTKTFKAYICGLAPSTSYQVRVVTADEETTAVSAVTEAAQQLYNFNFEAWYQQDKVWFAYNKGASAAERIWDSANQGTTMAGDSNTLPSSASGEFVSGKSVKMKTIWVSILGITKLAAGNIYTGRYNSTVGTSGADLDWGVEFECRPLGIRGHYRYDAVNINRTGDGYESYSGQPDLCQIQVVLQDAGQPYFVVPTTFNGAPINGPTLNRNDYCDLETHSSVIARGIKNYGDTGGKFKEIVLPCTYRSTERIPSHVIVTFSSSYLGDYFTGGEGSTMWADEYEFIYDPMELPADSRDAFFALFK